MTLGKQMSNYYAPCFYRINIVVIPSYIIPSFEKVTSKTSQKHLKSDECFCRVCKTSQIHLKKVFFFLTYLRRLKYISKSMSFT